MYGIFVNGKLDCEYERMVFENHADAVNVMQELIHLGIYDQPDKVSVELMEDE